MGHVNHHGADAPGLAAHERHQALIPEGRRPADEAGLLGDARTGDGADCAVDDEALQQAARHKRLSTVQARLALAGIALHELAGGAYLLVLPGYVAHLTDLEAVEGWARRARA